MSSITFSPILREEGFPPVSRRWFDEHGFDRPGSTTPLNLQQEGSGRGTPTTVQQEESERGTPVTVQQERSDTGTPRIRTPTPTIAPIQEEREGLRDRITIPDPSNPTVTFTFFNPEENALSGQVVWDVERIDASKKTFSTFSTLQSNPDLTHFVAAIRRINMGISTPAPRRTIDRRDPILYRDVDLLIQCSQSNGIFPRDFKLPRSKPTVDLCEATVIPSPYQHGVTYTFLEPVRGPFDLGIREVIREDSFRPGEQHTASCDVPYYPDLIDFVAAIVRLEEASSFLK